MDLVRFDDARLGAVADDQVVDITHVVPSSTREDERMRTLIAGWSRLRAIILPFPDRRTGYDGEHGLVIGRDAHHVGRADTLD